MLLIYTAPGDYGSLDMVDLMFQVGDAINSTLCVDVDIFDDEVVEYVEEFSVSLTSTDLVAPTAEANVSIFDNDRKCIMTYLSSDTDYTDLIEYPNAVNRLVYSV